MIVPERLRQSLSIPTWRSERARASTSHPAILVKRVCMESLRTCSLPFSPSHPFAKVVVLLSDRFVAFEGAAGPTLFANLLRVKLTLFVAVGVLLAAACAADGVFVFPSRFDGP